MTEHGLFKRNRKRRKKRVMPYYSLIILMLGVLIYTNFELVVLALNRDCYTRSEATVVDYGGDALTGVLPRVRVAYTYEDVPYEGDKVFLPKFITFDFVAETATVYINKKSPEDFLLPLRFFYSPVNDVCLLLVLFLSYKCIVTVRGNILVWKERRAERKEKQVK